MRLACCRPQRSIRASVGRIGATMPRTLFAIAFAGLLASCASGDVRVENGDVIVDPTGFYVTYTCNPAGATLYEDGRNVGVCPTELHYTLTDQDKENGIKSPNEITAVWVSGARGRTGSLALNLKDGRHQHNRSRLPLPTRRVSFRTPLRQSHRRARPGDTDASCRNCRTKCQIRKARCSGRLVECRHHGW